MTPAYFGRDLLHTLGPLTAAGLIATLAACGLGGADEHRRADEHSRVGDPASTIVVNGDVNHAAVHDLKRVLKLNADPSAQPADLRVFKGRPESNLQQSYGPSVTAALAKAAPGKWLALRARDGWRAMRLAAMKAMLRADFDTQRDALRQDWIEAQVADRRTAAVQELRKHYKIQLAPPFECHAESQ